jgi:hypothetical protein
LQYAYEAIVLRLEMVAGARLPAAIAPLLREAAATLARKRPSPLLRGDAASWASGIAFAICAENGLFEPRRRSLRLTRAELARDFGVALSTGAAKAAEARRHLRIPPPRIPTPDPRWRLPTIRAGRRRGQGAAVSSLIANPPPPRVPAPARAPARAGHRPSR